MRLIKICFFFAIPFSFVYFLLISLRNIFYRFNILARCKIDAKVISVGNITWGGTGKTPVVAFVAEWLLKANHTPAILIRGYGNDETELLSKLAPGIPVLVGKDRIETSRIAMAKYSVDAVLLDDGFQYARLKRDLDIVCIDATNPFGNGWLIPAGSMREGLRALKRADIFLITKIDLVSAKDKPEKLENRLRQINPKAVVAKAIHRPLYFYKISNEEKVNIGQVKNQEIVLVSAIGSPACFEKTILRLGLKINKHFVFRDHYGYTKSDITQIENYCGKNKLDTLITTEKDAVKLQGLEGIGHRAEGIEHRAEGIEQRVKCLVLKVRLEIIENEQGFYNRLFGIYNS